MDLLRGNAVVAPSGGPTAVINASACGVIQEALRAHHIRYFFYLGGNDSMDTADKVHRLAADQGYELRVLGVPKTVNNDLVATDHCPGYGSVAKYLAAAVMEAGRDNEAMYTFDAVTIMEAMGRNTGWIAAATGLARRQEQDAPHLIYVPEIPFSVERFLADVREVHRRLGRVFVVVSEGLVDEKGEYVT